MQLKEFLDKNEISMYGFAKRLGVSAPTVYNVAVLKIEPNLSLATRIEELTLGLVTCADLSHHKLRDKEAYKKDIQDKRKRRNAEGEKEHEKFIA